jgi:folate-binding protein YgfZ
LRDTTTERNYLLVAGEPLPVMPREAISWDIIGREGTRLLELKPQEVSSVVRSFVEQGFVVAGEMAFAAARIEAGTPLYGIDMGEHNFPQEVGRDHLAINFTKGCYLGQETVARIDALGHVNQRLRGLQFGGGETPPPGTEISIGGTQAGRVTSAAYSPLLDAPLALAMVRREANAPGIRIESPYGECRIVAFPANSS